jgi:hypothetical protein
MKCCADCHIKSSYNLLVLLKTVVICWVIWAADQNILRQHSKDFKNLLLKFTVWEQHVMQNKVIWWQLVKLAVICGYYTYFKQDSIFFQYTCSCRNWATVTLRYAFLGFLQFLYHILHYRNSSSNISTVFWIVTLYSLEITWHFGGDTSSPSCLMRKLPAASTDFLLGSLFSQDGGDMFLQNADLSLNYVALQLRQPYSSQCHCCENLKYKTKKLSRKRWKDQFK